MVNSKHAFWQALVLAIVVFSLGLIAGFFLESLRAEDVANSLLSSEANLLDEQLKEKLSQNFEINCSVSEKSLFEFADRIYMEAQNLEKYESSSKFSKSFLILHRRYDILRLMLWNEGISLKKECKPDFHTVIYLYNYAPENVEESARQSYYSRMLADLKEKYSNKILLIPIASNMNISSLDLVIKSYNLKKSPVILVDENEQISDIITFENLEKIVFQSHNE